MDIVSIQLQGGLGNQMFQIATTCAYAKRYNLTPKFDFNRCVTSHQGFSSQKYLNNLFKNLTDLDISKINFNNYFKEQKHSFTPIPKYNNNLFLDGYFQSEKYFNDFKIDIKNIFKLDEKYHKKINKFIHTLPNNDNLTALHVRRGDYLKFPGIHDVCTLEYYNKAMDIIGNGNFIVVSDDMDWCMDNIKGENIYYSPFVDELDDLLLIGGCKNKIIANSSFSWWSAYLSNYGGITIAPKKWFGVSGPKEQFDIIPEEWIKI
tara:strand:- start:315 stop:1100 length:786 start_codon:yes stop_codon:yes gene_type:complete